MFVDEKSRLRQERFQFLTGILRLHGFSRSGGQLAVPPALTAAFGLRVIEAEGRALPGKPGQGPEESAELLFGEIVADAQQTAEKGLFRIESRFGERLRPGGLRQVASHGSYPARRFKESLFDAAPPVFYHLRQVQVKDGEAFVSGTERKSVVSAGSDEDLPAAQPDGV